MSEQTDFKLTPSATERVGAEFEREKWLAENAFRDRELVLKEREQRRFEEELRLKREEAQRSRWSSLLVVAISTAALAGLLNAGVAWQSARDQRKLENDRAVTAQKAQALNSQSQLDLESFKAEAGRLFEVVKTNDPDKAAANLKFLLDVGLVSNLKIQTGLTTYLKNRETGQGVALPAAAPASITTLSNTPLIIDPASIIAIRGTYPSDIGPHTYLISHGAPNRGAIVTSEDPEALIDRLKLSTAFAKLTTPNQRPVWIRAAFIKHITQRSFDDAMRSPGLNGTVAIPKFSSWFY